ncbi:phosphatidate cytidylyltransferase [Kineothrix sp. MB12-C1]|uniref:phosphatidate cytidylyltransferase n=1 Tax=Kineothrix sp. MB12-C1 TaxID=3070215 RepID=UPI0027D224F5|nr:phosphatidate cytidylyltransferase [Kineothrix sp. MB12-C1]WMC92969.1 phosphatidate cytidylyltransferase [Kineothrix sp. MB12-C1]
MFMKRLFSSVVLILLALITLLQGGFLLTGILLFISLVAYYELCRACKVCEDRKRMTALLVVGYVGIIFYYVVLTFTENISFSLLCILFVMVAYMFVYVFSFPTYKASTIMAAFFSFVYAPVMFSFIYLVRELPSGIYIVWMIFISSWICDTCAYITGMLFGKHRLAPRLSPKKSVEGAIGGIAGSALVGGLYAHFIVERVIAEQGMTLIFIIISAIGAIISQIGDLAASAIKRDHTIKDYGYLIPGHGGIMDRFDSVIFTAPMIYALAVLLIKQM